MPVTVSGTEFIALLQYRGNHPRQLLIRWLYLGSDSSILLVYILTSNASLYL